MQDPLAFCVVEPCTFCRASVGQLAALICLKITGRGSLDMSQYSLMPNSCFVKRVCDALYMSMVARRTAGQDPLLTVSTPCVCASSLSNAAMDRLSNMVRPLGVMPGLARRWPCEKAAAQTVSLHRLLVRARSAEVAESTTRGLLVQLHYQVLHGWK